MPSREECSVVDRKGVSAKKGDYRRHSISKGDNLPLLNEARISATICSCCKGERGLFFLFVC